MSNDGAGFIALFFSFSPTPPWSHLSLLRLLSRTFRAFDCWFLLCADKSVGKPSFFVIGQRGTEVQEEVRQEELGAF